MKKITSLIFAIIFFTQPLLVLAGSPVADTSTAPATAGAATGALTTSQQVLKTLKDYGLDTVAYMLAQKLGQKMASLAINKANGGASADKDPNYIKDFGRIFADIEQQQRDFYTTKLLTNNNPYARAIAKDMLQSPYADQLSKFTLGNFMANGADISTAKTDLTAVGTNGLAFFGALANPANTPVGASLIAQNQLSQQIADKSRSELLKLTSPGFTPDTKCQSTITDFKVAAAHNQEANTALGNLNTSRLTREHAKAEKDMALETYGAGSPEALKAESDYNLAEKSTNESIAQQNTALSSALGEGATSTNKLAPDVAGCIDEIVKNPMSAVSTITAEGGKFGMDMTKNIQGWGQIVAGLFVSLFNGFINTGLSSLKADYGQQKTKQTNTGGPEQLTQKTLGGGVEGNTNFAKAPAIIIDLRNDLEPSIAATKENIKIIKETNAQLFLVPARLAILDMCLPGPDLIGLNKRLDGYYEFQTAWIQKNSATGSDHKNNIDQQLVISMLEQDFSIARGEMEQDMQDDSKNIPGSSSMRAMINTFAKKKAILQNNTEVLSKALDSLSQLQEINSQLKNSISILKQLEPAALGSLPGTVFTNDEWNATPQTDRDAIYNWMKTHSPNKPVELAGLTGTALDENHRKYVIKNSWDLWEYPFQFFPLVPVLNTDGTPALDSGGNPIMDKKWSDEKPDGTSLHSEEFLDKKNEIRGIFNNIKDIIPSPYEISKNTQVLTALKSDLAKTDDLIHDCDMMRYLIIGGGHAMEPLAPDGAPAPYNGKTPDAMLADMITNKNTYFKSEEVKNSLTLPNIFTRFAPPAVTPEQEGCRPYNENDYPAEFSPVKNIIGKLNYNGQEWVCMGNFGHIYGIENDGDIIEFDKWVDEGGNAYDSIPYISWPSELFWKSRFVKYIPPPAVDTYGKGWSFQTIDNGGVTGDDAFSRPLFCRNSAFMRVYGIRSGLEHPKRNFYCSSKWTDVSISQALGLFLINSLN